MFSNGNFFIFFLVLINYTSFIKFILAEKNISTNLIFLNNSVIKNNQSISNSNITATIINNNDTENIQNNNKYIINNKNDSSEILSNNFNKNIEIFENLPKPEALFGTNLHQQQKQQQHQQQQQQQKQSSASTITQNAKLPIFPERTDAVYFIVAVIGGAEAWSRLMARTLLDMGPPFGSSMGPPLRPLYIDLPANGRFSVNVLTSLCQQIENIPLAGIVVIGDGQSARAVALSGNAMKVPVLWARGGTANIYGIQREAQSAFQSMLQPSAREILKAIRALFLQTHWHSFFVLSDVDATMVLAGNEGRILKEPPLHPKILPLPAGDGDVFRQLAQISRSTRGIVLLLCNLVSARKIMSEAKRLNMAGGHFIWLWADTSSTIEFFDLHHEQNHHHHHSQQQQRHHHQNQQHNQHHQKNKKNDYFLEYPEAVKQFTVSSSSNKPSSENDNIDNNNNNNRNSGVRNINSNSNSDNKFDTDNDDGSDGQKDFYEHDINFLQIKNKQNIEKAKFKQPPNQPYQQQQQESAQNLNIKKSSNLQEEEEGPGRYIIGLTNPYNNHKSNIDSTKSNKMKQNNFNNNNNDDDDYFYNYDNSNDESVELNDDYNINNSDDLLLSDSLEISSSIEFENNYGWFTLNDTDINQQHQQQSLNNKKLKPKRTSSSSSTMINNYIKNLTLNSDVLFHHFKDFPIGLLALRPVKMPVDHHFIKSTIHLFASTWSKVEDDNNNYNNDGRSKNNNEEYSRIQIRSITNNDSNNDENISNNNNNNDEILMKRQKNHQNNNYYNMIMESQQQERISSNSNNRYSRKYSNRRRRRRRRRNIIDNIETVNKYLNIHKNLTNNIINNNNNISQINNNNNKNINRILLNFSSDLNSSIIIINKNVDNLINYNTDKNLSSDLNEINIISSNNQNLSGLTTKLYKQKNLTNINNNNIQSNIKNYTKFNNNLNLKINNKNLNNEIIINKKQKRQNWWSTKDSTNRFKQPQLKYHQHQQQQFQISNQGYRGGCFGNPNVADVKRAELFAKALQETTEMALAGQRLPNGIIEKSLTTNFELLNLVPDDIFKNNLNDDSELRRRRKQDLNQLTKWRRVGIISGNNVQLDTIVWPGGDIVVSGLSSQSRTIFRIVTALAPPFVMESDRDEDGLCLRGLPCHRLLPSVEHNLTLMFNAIETMDRLKEDAVEHGVQPPKDDDRSNYDHNLYSTKCCYGLSMDLLDNIATELEFEFHLYIVRDELFGTKFTTLNDFMPPKQTKSNKKRRKQSSLWNLQNINNKKDQYTNRIHYPPEGRNYHSASSFDRNINLNINSGKGNTITKDSAVHNQDNTIVIDSDNVGNGDIDNDETGNNDNLENQFTDWKNANREREEFFDENDSDESDEEINSDKSDYEDENIRHLRKKAKWNGIIGDLISGSADMSFSPLTISRARSKVIDFSAPYFHSGVSLLAAPQTKSEIPLLAFLLPFSPELWIAIFTSLNVTAVAVAIYEWLSPFGLNPWGRQRSKNFSMSSALWVMWGLLCGHLVAFKAPKSWPNKFLINVWGGFSVIFIASYTANIAALIAGLFFHNAGNRPEVSLLTQRVGAPIASATESFMKQYHHHTWEHMKKFSLNNLEDGIRGLKNGTLDLVLGDTAILDYYRATDHGCNLAKIGEPYVADTYGIGMTKGFPLKESISALIAKYSSNGYLDILTEKWYGGLPCFKLDNDIVMPRPLGVAAVAGVFLLLGLGVILGVLILIFEHLFFKYTLPILRLKPKGTVWRSRNIMFFSQKLYRFINCVELVSPHHAARELVHTLRQGQIASLFQKSIKRKEDEQRRRRKSKAQFFEMIQEIRRVQQAERMNPKLEVVTEVASETNDTPTTTIPEIIVPSPNPSPRPRTSPKPKSSPIQKIFRNATNRSRSNSSTLNVRRFSTDSILSDRLDTIGRRLSRDLTNSPPDFGRRFDSFNKNGGGIGKFDTYSGKNVSTEKIEETNFDTYSSDAVKPNPIDHGSGSKTLPAKKHQTRRMPINSETFSSNHSILKQDVGNNTEKNNDDRDDNQKLKEPASALVIVKSKLNQRNPLYASIEPRKKSISNKDNIKDKRTVQRSSSSSQTSTNHHILRNSRPVKRLNQPLHHRQRSLDGLDTRPPMPLPATDDESPQRPVSRDRLDLTKIVSSDDPTTDLLKSKVSNSNSNGRQSEFKRISLDRLSREDLLKLSESSQTEIHEYLSKSITLTRTFTDEDDSLEPP